MIYITKNIIFIIVTFIAVLPLLVNLLEKQYILSAIYLIIYIYILNPLITRIIKKETRNTYCNKK